MLTAPSSAEITKAIPIGTSSSMNLFLDNIIQVSAGSEHACALLNSGIIKCWGSNSGGQLGNGETTDSLTPVTVTGISDAVSVASGGMHSCAVLNNGTVKCWGYNLYGQLGYGGLIESPVPPRSVSGISNAVAVTANDDYSCALLTPGGILGNVKCWGKNNHGQLGNGATSSSPALTPVRVSDLTTLTRSGFTYATEIAAGQYSACAVLNTGEVRCWGDNYSTTPVSVSGINNAVSIMNGEGHYCAILNTGEVACWGGSSINVSGITTAVTSANDSGRGSDHSCFVLTNGEVTCWGMHGGDDIDADCDDDIETCYEPATVSGISNATAVSLGKDFACATLRSGYAKCWGVNWAGQLGNGVRSNSVITVVGPVMVKK